jgi:hypothetical protein
LLTIGQVNKLYSHSEDQGYAVESNAVIWVPTLAGRKAGSRFNVERLVLIPAYAIVHQPYSLLGGHETYGFFKGFGKTFLWLDHHRDPILLGESPHDLPRPDISPRCLEVQVVGLKRFGSHNRIQAYPLFEMTRLNQEYLGAKTMPWKNPLDILHDLKSLMFDPAGRITIPGLEVAFNLAIDTLKHEFPVAFLKQFRDARTPHLAVYQAIIEAPVQIQRLQDVRLLDDYNFSIKEHLENYPIAHEIGLSRQKALMSFVVNMDFMLGVGTEIWRAARGV